MFHDLSTHHDWSVEKAIVDLPIKVKGSSKCTSGNSLSSLGAQNVYLGTASKTLPIGVKLRLQWRLGMTHDNVISWESLWMFMFRVAVSRSKDVPPFGPNIPAGAKFGKQKAFADFLLTKGKKSLFHDFVHLSEDCL